MQTSYFAKYKPVKGQVFHGVSIAAKAPKWFAGRQYKQLAPSYSIFKQWKDSCQDEGDWIIYAARYNQEILAFLDPAKVLSDLGSDAVMLCYERPEAYCHRHLVSTWLTKNTDQDVTEIGIIHEEDR